MDNTAGNLRRWMTLCEAAVDQLHAQLADRYQYQSNDEKVLQGLTKDSKDLNRHLHQQYRDHKRIPDLKRTRQLDAAIERYRTPVAFNVYYGASHEVQSGIYHHAGYLHTSLSLEMAIGFANVNTTRWDDVDGVMIEHHHLIKIRVPQGHHGAYVGHLSQSQSAKHNEFGKSLIAIKNEDHAL